MSGRMWEMLPADYRWLGTVGPLPRMLRMALTLYDTRETAGAGNTPAILAWAEETGLARTYRADAVPWCGLFMAVVAQRAGWTVPDAPLWALNWGRFGVAAAQPMLGDVLTFARPGGGHVALYVGEDVDAYHLLGGNQGDRVGFARIVKTRLRAARRPPYRVAPASVAVRRLATGGGLSANEA